MKSGILTSIIFVSVCALSAPAQNINEEAIEFGVGSVKGFLEGDAWVDGPPLYFAAGPLRFQNVTTGITLRQEGRAIVKALRDQVDGALRIPHHVSVGLDRFTIVGFAEGALANCDMTSLYIPGDIRTIPARCFESCDNLKEVILHGGLVFVENAAFRWTRSLSTINLPSSVKYIGEYAFDQSGLTHIDIPEKTEFLGQGAFRNCTNLKSVKFNGHRIGEIQGYCFEKCESLESVILPAGTHSIMSYAFKDSGVKYLSLPKTMQKIYKGAFDGTSIERIDSYAIKPPDTGAIFKRSDAERIELHVPRGFLSAYRSAPSWKHIIRIIDDL